jgi:hypothetical protein
VWLDGDIIRRGQELLDEVARSESTCNRTVCLARMKLCNICLLRMRLRELRSARKSTGLWSLFGAIMGTGRGAERFDS